MSMNSPDYLTYKKSKINPQVEKQKRLSRLKVALWIFIITFSIIFAVVVQVVRKYSARIDIEYGRNADAIGGSESVLSEGFGSDAKKLIDKRLKLIQLEENAPSEAKIISDEKENNEVIDLEQFAKIKDSGNIEDDEINIKIENASSHKTAEQKQPQDNNVAVYSKVLIGKYSTFEDAQKLQNEIKTKDPTLSPFVRKVGDVFSVQMGSYKDFDIAKKQAQLLKFKGFDVWIYQQ